MIPLAADDRGEGSVWGEGGGWGKEGGGRQFLPEYVRCCLYLGAARPRETESHSTALYSSSNEHGRKDGFVKRRET